MQDVPAYVRRKGLAFACYLDTRRPAVIDAEHCVRLNYEAFFFADLWERERFLSDPLAYCGLLTDPVTRRRFRPTPASPSASHAGVTYYFEREEHRARFLAAPEALSRPGWTM